MKGGDGCNGVGGGGGRGGEEGRWHGVGGDYKERWRVVVREVRKEVLVKLGW